MLLALLPLAVNVLILGAALHDSIGFAFGFDFHAFWVAGGDVLHRESPYPPPTAEALKGEDQYVYPPSLAFVLAPLALLPFALAAIVFAAILVASVFATLRILGVRDWRCYGATFLCLSVIDGVRLGSISALIALGAAVAWRYRDNRWVVAAAVGALVAAKIFLWPLLVWLVATRRTVSALVAAAAGAAATLAAWSLIGFAGLSAYPALLGALADLLQRKSYSLVALVMSLGVAAEDARRVALVVGAVALASIFVLVRSRDGDRTAFVAALGAALLLSPIVWSHYFVLLLVPLGISRPRFSAAWLLPVLLWLSPNQSDGETVRIGIVLVVALVVFALTLRPANREGFTVRLRKLRPAAVTDA